MFGGDSYRENLKAAYDSVVRIDKLSNAKVIVAGATGLIGGFLVDLLLFANDEYAANIEVYALARDLKKLESRFEDNLNNAQLHFIIQDVVEPIPFKGRVDYIINAAGDGYPAAFREHPVETMTPAFIGTYNLLMFAKKNGVKRFLNISSGEVYGIRIGEKKAFCEEEDMYARSMNVRECYPEAKRAAEILCASFYQEYGLETVVTRLSHTYGILTSDRDNRATVQFINSAKSGKNIELYSEGKQMRSYTYVVDAVSGILTVLLCGNAGEAYNIANKNARISIAGFAECVASIFGVECIFNKPSDVQVKEHSPLEYAILDSSKLESLGWEGKYTVEDGIKTIHKMVVKV